MINVKLPCMQEIKMDIEHQLQSILDLLESMKWLYDFPVTQLFSHGVFDQMPEEWKELLCSLSIDELNGLPKYQSKAHWPKSLQNFLNQCKALSLSEFTYSQNEIIVQKPENLPEVCIPDSLLKGMSAKKKHEVCRLTALIKAVEPQCNHVVDFGSGKGYIDTALHSALGLNVLGAESETSRVTGAEERQATLLKQQCQGIEHIKWILEDNKETISEGKKIIGNFSQKTVCPKDNCLRNIYYMNKSKNKINQDKRYVRSNCSEEKNLLSAPVQNITEEVCSLDISKPNSTEINSTNLNKCKDENTKLNDRSVEKFNDIQKCIQRSKVSTVPVTLIGLHACADLSPIIMKLFSHSDNATHMILLSCCYHKLKVKNSQENLTDCSLEPKLLVKSSDDSIMLNQKYSNFPMSKALNSMMSRSKFSLSVYGLRLAAQESGLRWDNQTEEHHLRHANNVIFRAVLEEYCQKGHFKLHKLKRKCANKSKYNNFNEYVDSILLNHEITIDPSNTNEGRKNPSREEIISGLEFSYESQKLLFPLVEPLTGLQLALQPVLEALVLLDRVMWLRESNISKVWLQPLFDPELSPRCVALCAVK